MSQPCRKQHRTQGMCCNSTASLGNTTWLHVTQESLVPSFTMLSISGRLPSFLPFWARHQTLQERCCPPWIRGWRSGTCGQACCCLSSSSCGEGGGEICRAGLLGHCQATGHSLPSMLDISASPYCISSWAILHFESLLLADLLILKFKGKARRSHPNSSF